MSHPNSKPSLHHTPRSDSLYLDDVPPDSTSTQQDKNHLLSKSFPEQKEIGTLEAVLSNEPDAEDAELIRRLKSEYGHDLIHSLCQTEGLKNLLIDFMQETKNPELRNVLRDSIFTNQGLHFDSTIKHVSDATFSSATPIAELLTTKPDSTEFLSYLFIKMQSNELVQHLLLESERTSLPALNFFLLDTLPKMDQERVVLEILERQNMMHANQKLLSTILQQIGEEPACRKMISDWDEQHHNGRLPIEAEEPRQTRYQSRAHKEPRLTPGDKIEQVHYSSDGPDDIAADGETNEDLSFWQKVEAQFDRVVDAITNIFESNWVKKIFRVGWIKDSFNRAINYLEQKSSEEEDSPGLVDHLRSKYNQLLHEPKSRLSLEISLLDQKPPTAHSLVSFLQSTDDQHVWDSLQQFFISFQDQKDVIMILLELQQAPADIKEWLLQLLIKMEPKATIPVIIENQFQLARAHISHQDLLNAIQHAHANDQQLAESAPEDVAILPHRGTPEAPGSKAAPTLLENPPGPLQFLDSDNEELRVVTSIYLANENDQSKHLNLLLRDLAMRSENGTLSERNIANALHIFKVIGPERVIRILLDEQNHREIQMLRPRLLAELAQFQSV